MSRITNKYFYISLVGVSAIVGLVFPLWFIFQRGPDIVSVSSAYVRHIPVFDGILLYAATSALAIIATLMFMHACNNLEIKGANTEL